jgi:hypothetical protein
VFGVCGRVNADVSASVSYIFFEAALLLRIEYIAGGRQEDDCRVAGERFALKVDRYMQPFAAFSLRRFAAYLWPSLT